MSLIDFLKNTLNTIAGGVTSTYSSFVDSIVGTTPKPSKKKKRRNYSKQTAYVFESVGPNYDVDILSIVDPNRNKVQNFPIYEVYDRKAPNYEVDIFGDVFVVEAEAKRNREIAANKKSDAYFANAPTQFRMAPKPRKDIIQENIRRRELELEALRAARNATQARRRGIYNLDREYEYNLFKRDMRGTLELTTNTTQHLPGPYYKLFNDTLKQGAEKFLGRFSNDLIALLPRVTVNDIMMVYFSVPITSDTDADIHYRTKIITYDLSAPIPNTDYTFFNDLQDRAARVGFDAYQEKYYSDGLPIIMAVKYSSNTQYTIDEVATLLTFKIMGSYDEDFYKLAIKAFRENYKSQEGICMWDAFFAIFFAPKFPTILGCNMFSSMGHNSSKRFGMRTYMNFFSSLYSKECNNLISEGRMLESAFELAYNSFEINYDDLPWIKTFKNGKDENGPWRTGDMKKAKERHAKWIKEHGTKYVIPQCTFNIYIHNTTEVIVINPELKFGEKYVRKHFDIPIGPLPRAVIVDDEDVEPNEMDMLYSRTLQHIVPTIRQDWPKKPKVTESLEVKQDGHKIKSTNYYAKCRRTQLKECPPDVIEAELKKMPVNAYDKYYIIVIAWDIETGYITIRKCKCKKPQNECKCKPEDIGTCKVQEPEMVHWLIDGEKKVNKIESRLITDIDGNKTRMCFKNDDEPYTTIPDKKYKQESRFDEYGHRYIGTNNNPLYFFAQELKKLIDEEKARRELEKKLKAEAKKKGKTRRKRLPIKYLCVAHNGAKFDLIFLHELLTEHIRGINPTFAGNSIMKIKSPYIDFVDSNKIMPGSLDSLATAFKIGMNKSFYPYEMDTPELMEQQRVTMRIPDKKYWNDNVTYTATKTGVEIITSVIPNGQYDQYVEMKAKELNWSKEDVINNYEYDIDVERSKYCEQDVRVLMKVWKEMSLRLMKEGSGLLYNVQDASTASILAFKAFLQNVDYDLVAPPRAALNRAIQSLFGGLTGHNKEFIQAIKGWLIAYIDINSSYPYVMTKDLPYLYVRSDPLNENVEIKDFVKHHLYEVKIKYPELMSVCPCTQTRGDEGVCNPYDQTDMWRPVYGYALKLALKQGAQIWARSVDKYTSAPLFRKFIQDKDENGNDIGLYPERGRLKALTKQPGVSEQEIATADTDIKFIKLLMNSPFGKTAQRVFGTTKIVHERELPHYVAKADKIRGETQICINEYDGDRYIINYISKADRDYNCGNLAHIASYITTVARCRLVKMMLKIGMDNVAYYDTDSIVFRTIHNVHEDDRIKDKINDTRLGAFKLEGYLDWIKATGPKMYQYQEREGQKHIVTKIKGINKKSMFIVDQELKREGKSLFDELIKGEKVDIKMNLWQRTLKSVMIDISSREIKRQEKKLVRTKYEEGKVPQELMQYVDDNNVLLKFPPTLPYKILDIDRRMIANPSDYY